MEKNLITEIHRISELIGVKNKITLNEGVLGKLFKNVAEEELEALIRQEVRNAILSGVETVERDAATLAAAEARVVSKIGGKTLTNAQKKGIQAELFRLAKEEAETLGKRTKGSTKGLTAAQNDAFQKAAAAERKRLGVKSLGQGTREKLIQKVTTGGKKVTLKVTKPKPKNAKFIQDWVNKNTTIATQQGWNWTKFRNRAAIVGIGAVGLWWVIANWDENDPIKPIVPEDMPKTDEGLTDTGGVTNRYRNCDNEPKYTKGCKSEAIKPVQTCLGLVPDGKFWVKTQAALVEKGFPNGFTDADVSKICGNQTPPPPPQPEDEYEDAEGQEADNLLDN